MSLEAFIRAMPKVELHVHLEGSIQPDTLFTLAHRNNVTLPANNVDDLRQWYQFTSFDHFVQIYLLISAAICTSEDIEWIMREFLRGQAAQNIRYSEITYTALTQYRNTGIPFAEQLAALNSARQWAEDTLGVSAGLVIDISRQDTSPEESRMVAEWAISGMGNGVVALGLGGAEVGYPPELFTEVFAMAREAGLPGVPHAGETEGPSSIWGALQSLNAIRIGHGVRCLENDALVEVLRERQIPLEVCPTSNICLGVFPRFEDHALPKLLERGLYVTINSDDPPMFNTTLTDEYLKSAAAFDLDADAIERLVMNALNVSLLPEAKKTALRSEFTAEFARLRTV